MCLSQCQASRNGPVEPHVVTFPAAETLPSTPSLPPAASVRRTYRNLMIFRASTSVLFWTEISQWICEWLRKKRSADRANVEASSLQESCPKTCRELRSVGFWQVSCSKGCLLMEQKRINNGIKQRGRQRSGVSSLPGWHGERDQKFP